MKAGRELDALIAEKVLGLSGVRDGKSWLYGDNWTHNKEGVLCLVPHYSTQIADAWLVVEKMLENGYMPTITHDLVAWSVCFIHIDKLEEKFIDRKWRNGLATQICVAALKAVE